MRVYDAVITTKLLYGLEPASLSNADKKRLDAFQNKGPRKILGIKHAYFSRIQVITTANQETKLKKHKDIIKMSKQLEQRQITLFAHILRAPEDDEMKKISSVQPNGKRVWAGFRRVGRPKLKWYEIVRSSTIGKLTNLNILPANWKNEMSETEMLQMIIDTAHDRDSNIL